MEEGVELGEICNRDSCKGIIEEHDSDGGCSCHINPPCSYCETPREFCPECDWSANDEMLEEMEKTVSNWGPLPKQETIEEKHARLDKKYAQDDGELYKIVRYFDSYREGVNGSNMKLGEALRLLDTLNRKPRYYVSYSLKKQDDKTY